MNRTLSRKKNKFFIICAMISSAIYITWRLFFTIPLSHGWLALIAGILLVSAEFIGVVEAFFYYKSLGGELVEKPEIPLDMYPDVDVLIATHSESPDLLYKTINGCKHMQYPKGAKVNIYLCDDKNRPEMKDLAEEMNIDYFGLSDNKHAKAGNLNNALKQTHAPLVATFDADMIPRSNFLLEAVPYFLLPEMIKSEGHWRKRKPYERNPFYKIGFIQTPQSFYNPDLFQFNLYAEKNIPNEQDFFFQEINVGRNKTNSAIYAGSNTLISRKALASVNYIRTGTITEDIATGIDIQRKGYTCYAIPTVLAHGLAPSDFKSLVKQRQRWGSGVVQTLRKAEFLFCKMPFSWKMSYYVSFLYWWTFVRRAIFIASPILYTVFDIKVVDASSVELAIIWLPSFLFYNKALKILSGNIRNQIWNNIVDTIIFPYMVFPIIGETFGIKLKHFLVTPKEKVMAQNVGLKYAIPHGIFAFLTLIGLIKTLMHTIDCFSFGNLVLMYWLLINMYLLTMAFSFMVGRTNYRKEERLYAKVDIGVNCHGRIYRGITSDISEGGMAVVFDYPEYLPYDKTFILRATTGKYHAKMRVKLVHVAQIGEKWKYSFRIVTLEGVDKDSYHQIVYDRHHTLPVVMKTHLFKDLKTALTSRLQRMDRSNRLLPRIPMNRVVKTSRGMKVHIVDFNYEYILIKGAHRFKHLRLLLDNGLVIDCQLDSTKLLSTASLYRVNNWQKLAQDYLMRSWVKEGTRIDSGFVIIEEVKIV